MTYIQNEALAPILKPEVAPRRHFRFEEKCNNFAIFRPIWPKFGPKLDLGMGHREAMLPERYGAVHGAAAPFPAAPPSKWRPLNNSVIFQPICFKFEYKVDRRMGHDVATPLQRYGAVGGAVAPFPVAPL